MIKITGTINQVKEKNMMELAKYQESLYKNPKLRYLFFELTDKCNLNCKHCGSRCSIRNGTYLPFEAIKRTLESVAVHYDVKSIMVCLTGGEPFLHPDIFRITNCAHELGFPVGITTNATIIDKEKAMLLTLVGLNTITVSIDGVGRVHDDFRRVEGCFGKTVEGIHNLKSVGIEPEVLTVVHKGNIRDLKKIYDFLKEEDIFAWRLTNVDPIGRAAMNNAQLLSESELKILYNFIEKQRFDSDNDMDVSYGCSHFLGMDYENKVRDYYFQCGAGLFVGSVMANGNIGACLDIERRDDLIQGNIFQDDFVQVWEHRYEIFRRNRVKSSRKCSSCQHKNICMGDSCHTWDYDDNEPRYCVVKMMQEEG